MTKGFKEKLHWTNGYVPNMNIVGNERYKDGLAIGSKNTWLEGRDRIRSWDGVRSFGTFGNRIMHLVGAALGTLTTGNIIRFRDTMTWVVGTGPVKLGTGGAGTTFTGTAQQFLQFVAAFGTLQKAGVPKILMPPTLEIGTKDGNPNNTNASNLINKANFPNLARNNGEVSIKVSCVALDTQSEGNASPPSASINFTDQAGRILLPPSTIPTRLNSYRIYSSKRNFGKFGPWFFLVETGGGLLGDISRNDTSNVIKNANNPGGILISDLTFGGFYYTWSDGDLKSVFAPIDNNAPPDGCTHLFSLGDLMVLVYPAGRILVSLPGFPEAYPIDFESFLDPQEDVIGIRGRQGDGWQYLMCRNSLHAASISDDPTKPLDLRAIWPSCGIATANAAAFWHDILYAFSAAKGFVRTNGVFGAPDSTFGLDVESDLIRLSVNIDECCVGWHQDEDCIVYFFGDVAFVYKVKLGMWCAPFYIQDGGVPAGQRAVGCETLSGRLIFSTTDGTMYTFSGGASTTVPWKAIPFWRDGGAEGEGYPTTISHYTYAYEIPMGSTLTAILRTNFDLETAAFIHTATGGTNGRGKYAGWAKLGMHQDVNGDEIKSFTVEFQGVGGNQVVYNGIVLGGKKGLRI